MSYSTTSALSRRRHSQLTSALKEHATPKSLCGNKGNETKLDMSSGKLGKQLGAEGAIMLAPGIAGNGAMTKLDISSNSLQANGGKALAAGLKGNQVITELSAASNYLGVQNRTDNTDMSGVVVIALADAIHDMGAMTSLYLASNNLCTGGAKIVAEAIEVTKCTPAIILA
jgi:hypothetical protein